jgi:Repeat of unknown function (DUF5648)
VYRFYNTQTQTHFYTPSVLERDHIRANFESFNFEGVGFYVPETSDYLLT